MTADSAHSARRSSSETGAESAEPSTDGRADSGPESGSGSETPLRHLAVGVEDPSVRYDDLALSIRDLAVEDGTLLLGGVLRGTITTDVGTTRVRVRFDRTPLGPVDEVLEPPLVGAGVRADAGSVSVVRLDATALVRDVVGVRVDDARVDVTVAAAARSGTPPGNLLEAITERSA